MYKGALVTVTAVMTLVVLLSTALLLRGDRYFIIESPSMGATAPVGTLVITSPVPWSDLRVGDIITFHPPTDPRETFTHRIVAITAHGIATKGDLNTSRDAWLLRPGDIVGRAEFLWSRWGWFVQALPWLLGVTQVLWWATRRLTHRDQRWALRHLGLVSTAVILARYFHVLFNVVQLGETSTGNGTSIHLVSEGLVPLRLDVAGESSQFLSYGHSTTLKVVATGSRHVYRVSEHAVLDPTIIGVILALSILPYVVVTWHNRRHPPVSA